MRTTGKSFGDLVNYVAKLGKMDEKELMFLMMSESGLNQSLAKTAYEKVKKND